MSKRKIHDGIVGAVIVLSILAAHFFNYAWILLPLVLGAVLVSSAFTGFCPLYFLLDRVCKCDKD